MAFPIDVEAVLRDLRVASHPRSFLAILPPIAAIPDEEFFRSAAYQPLREAWAAGRLARAFELQGHAIAVRIAGADEQFPDFYVKCDVQEHAFELTEALEAGRLRGDEYKKFAKESTILRPYHAVGRIEGQEAVAEAIRRKASKRYSESPHLLVYADFTGEGIDLKNCLALCGDACTRFASVWVLMAIWVAKLFDKGHFPEAPMTPFPFEP
jgi:hypothetical protein